MTYPPSTARLPQSQKAAALRSIPYPARSESASRNDGQDTSAATANAWTSATPSDAKDPWWKSDIRTHAATMDSEIEQLGEVKEQLEKIKTQHVEGTLSDKQEELWKTQDSHSANIGVARDSLEAPIRAARREGCTWANMKTIMDEGGENAVREEKVQALWDVMSRGSCSECP